MHYGNLHNYRANEEVTQLNDLVALLLVFREGEEGEDPELQEGKAVQARFVLISYSQHTYRILSGPKLLR